MRLIKMFGLAAIAAVAAMAFVGASSASATNTALCLKSEAVCTLANQVKTVHFVSTNSQLLPSGLNPISCTEVLLTGEVLPLGNPQQIHFTGKGITYSGCSTTLIFKVNCTVTATHLGLLDLLKTAANLGTVVDLAVGGKFTEVSVVCAGIINCTYKGENLTGHALGAPENTNGSVKYEKSPVTKVAGGELCPESATLDGTFVSLAPPIFISE